MALLVVLMLSLALLARWLGWGILRILLVLAIGWAAVLAAMLVAPAAEIRAAGQFDLRSWLALGVIGGLAIGYATLISRMRQRADARWGDPHAVSVAQAATARQAATDAAGDDYLTRYARHIMLREIGGPGQQNLGQARVLVVGAGGIGAPALLYLAAAGIGTITIADDDEVSVSNLQRQIIFRTADAGRPKAQTAATALGLLNPLIDLQVHPHRITAADAMLVAAHDLVLDGTDDFSERSLINQLCADAAVPLIAGALAQWEGQLTIYDPASGAPCFACIFPQPPAPGLVPSCAQAGVIGPLPGVIGSMMAIEAIKLICGVGAPLRGDMLIYDALYGETRRIAIARSASCHVCGAVQPRLATT